MNVRMAMAPVALLAVLAAAGCATRLRPRPMSAATRAEIEAAVRNMDAVAATVVFKPTAQPR